MIIERTAKDKSVVPVSQAARTDHYALSQRKGLDSISQLNLPNLQSLLWDKVGIVRSGEGLLEAADILYKWQKPLPQPIDRLTYELNNMILNARMMTEAALIREESRGAHFRTDFPESSPDWQKHIIYEAKNLP